MSLQVRYCPQCGTRRTGYFRFCGRCGLDFDELSLVRPDAAEAPKTEAKPEPTTPIWPPPAQWPPAGALPSAAVKALTDVPPTPAAASTTGAASTAGAAAKTAPVPAATAPESQATTAPEPEATSAPEPEATAVRWPGADALAPRPQKPADRPLLARSVPVPEAIAPAAAAVEPVPRGNVIPSRPGVTWTRIAIVVLGGLLAFSALARAVTPSYYANPTPAPTTVVESPLVVGPSTGPTATPAASIVASSAGASFGPTGQTQVAVVTRIVDGDTIHVDIDGTDHAVRYIGMDTPEPSSTDPQIKLMADSATAQNAQFVEGQEVYLEKDVSETDQYGRLLRDVWLVDKTGAMVLINLELVRMGYAQVTTFPPDVKYVDLLTTAQKQAQAQRAGMWGASGSTPTSKAPQTLVGGGGPGASCHPSYSPCLPIVDDLDCADVRQMGKAPVTVKGSDPYRLDNDHDGVGCE